MEKKNSPVASSTRHVRLNSAATAPPEEKDGTTEVVVKAEPVFKEDCFIFAKKEGENTETTTTRT